MDPAAYSIAGFCAAHDISRSQFYKLCRHGLAPRLMHVGSRTLSAGKPPPTGGWSARLTIPRECPASAAATPPLRRRPPERKNGRPGWRPFCIFTGGDRVIRSEPNKQELRRIRVPGRSTIQKGFIIGAGKRD